jgi:hypothetical protein
MATRAEMHAAQEDRFKGLTGPTSGAMSFPTTRSKRATFSDSAVLDFHARCFVTSAKGKLTVDDEAGDNHEILVTEGLNAHRIRAIYSTGSDAITVDYRD